MLAIRGDEELDRLFVPPILAAGIVPHIHQNLLKPMDDDDDDLSSASEEDREKARREFVSFAGDDSEWAQGHDMPMLLHVEDCHGEGEPPIGLKSGKISVGGSNNASKLITNRMLRLVAVLF
jgi:hypothetical protein